MNYRTNDYSGILPRLRLLLRKAKKHVEDRLWTMEKGGGGIYFIPGKGSYMNPQACCNNPYSADAKMFEKHLSESLTWPIEEGWYIKPEWFGFFHRWRKRIDLLKETEERWATTSDGSIPAPTERSPRSEKS